MLPKSPANDTSIEVADRGGGSSDSANDTEVLKSGEMGGGAILQSSNFNWQLMRTAGEKMVY